MSRRHGHFDKMARGQDLGGHKSPGCVTCYYFAVRVGRLRVRGKG